MAAEALVMSITEYRMFGSPLPGYSARSTLLPGFIIHVDDVLPVGANMNKPEGIDKVAIVYRLEKVA